MEATKPPFETVDSCPVCTGKTSVIKLGGEPAREICQSFTCDWSGNTLE